MLTALPILSVALYIHFFGLNIPFWDQWNFVSYLMLADQGGLTPAALVAQLNEHRPFFPRQTIAGEDLAQIHFDPAIAGPQIEFLRGKGFSAWGQRDKRTE